MAKSIFGIGLEFPKIRDLIAYVPYGLCFLWWLALFPGIFSVDSGSYAYMADTKNFSQDYSIWWPIYLYLTSLGGNFVSGITLINSLISVFAMKNFLEIFFSKEIAFRATLFLSLTPVFGAMSIHLWRDISMAWGFLLLFSGFNRYHKQQYLSKRDIFIILLSFLGIFTRPNGFISILIIAIFLLIKPRKFRVTRKVAALLFLITLFSNLILPRVLNLYDQQSNSQSSALISPFLSDISCVFSQSPDLISQSEKQILLRITAIEVWQNPTACGVVNPISYSPATDYNYVNNNKINILKVWFRVFQENPRAVYEGRIMRTNSFLPPPLVLSNGRVYFLQYGNVADYPNLFESPVQDVLRVYIGIANFYSNVLGWSGLWFLVILFILKRIRVSKEIYNFIGLSLLSILVVLLNAPASDARYGLPVLWCGYGLLICYLIEKRRIEASNSLTV